MPVQIRESSERECPYSVQREEFAAKREGRRVGKKGTYRRLVGCASWQLGFSDDRKGWWFVAVSVLAVGERNSRSLSVYYSELGLFL